MNAQEISRLTGISVEEIYERTGKTEDIHISEINPLFNPNKVEDPDICSVTEAAKITGFSETHIYKLMASGNLPYIQKGGRKYPYRAELELLDSSGKPDHIQILERWMDDDPELRLHILQKYGIEDILQRLFSLEAELHYIKGRLFKDV